MPSTRVKDLVDLVLIATEVTVDAAELRRALEHTFETRGRQPLPAQLSLPPAEWRAPYRRMAGEVGVAEDIVTAHTIIGALVDPILARQVTDASWDPERSVWHTSAN